jgi:membrane protein implicated in regulation of membrane protease activity
MTLGSDSGPRPAADPSKRWMLVAAGILLAIPLVALMWVSSYAKATPRIGGFPFFFWYQFLWVFICSAMTYAAHRLVLAARKKNGGSRDGSAER